TGDEELVAIVASGAADLTKGCGRLVLVGTALEDARRVSEWESAQRFAIEDCLESDFAPPGSWTKTTAELEVEPDHHLARGQRALVVTTCMLVNNGFIGRREDMSTIRDELSCVLDDPELERMLV